MAGNLSPLLNASSENPPALIIGFRADSPASRICHLLFRLETGLRLKNLDGPRVYPLALIDLLDPEYKRCFSEIELLVRAAWAGCPIVEILLPANSPGDSLQSGSTRQALHELPTHLRLLVRALSGWPHRKYETGIVRLARQPFWPRVWRWLNPFAAWRELRQGGIGRNDMAVGLACGVFIGNMPVWGFHTAISLYVAKRLHLNPLAVMTGSHISAPPMGIVIVASAMWTGHVLLHGAAPKWENITPFHGKFMEHLASNLLDWTLGAVLIGTFLAIISYIIANFLFRFIERDAHLKKK